MSQAEDFEKLWNYTDSAGTEKKFRELLAQSDAAPQSYRLQLMTQLARTLGLQRRFADADAMLDEVARWLTDEMKTERVRFLLERGRVLNSSGHPQQSRRWFVEAFTLAHTQRLDFHSVDAAHMLGIVEESPKDQMMWNEMALMLAEQSDDPRAKNWAGSLYNNMGWTRFEQKEYDKALDLFQRGVEFRVRANQPRELRIAKYAVTRTLRAMNRIDEAHQLMRAVFDEAAGSAQEDGYFYEELAEILLLQGKPAQARPLFVRAHALLSQDPWTVEHESERLNRLKKLSEPS